MLHLIPMSESDYQQFITMAIDDYARQQITAGEWRQDVAHGLSRQVFGSLLPQGLSSPGHFLNMVEREEDKAQVGYIWFGVREEEGNRFVVLYDFMIFEQYRRQGYGREALEAMEKKVREIDIKSVALHVFGHNTGARALYRNLGYIERNVTMVKELED